MSIYIYAAGIFVIAAVLFIYGKWVKSKDL